MIRKFALAKGMFLTKISLAMGIDLKPETHTPVKKIRSNTVTPHPHPRALKARIQLSLIPYHLRIISY